MNETTSSLPADMTSGTTFPEWPWLTMLVQPRSTIRAIVDTDATRYVTLLAALYGIANSFSRAEGQGMGDHITLAAVVVLSIALGSVSGVIGLQIGGAILAWSGDFFGGKASSAKVRAAMAWSSIPVILTLFFVPPSIMVYGNDLYTTSMTHIEDIPLPYFMFAVGELVLTTWWLYLFWKSYAEVQQLSLTKALIATSAPGLLVAGILSGCALLL